MVKLKAFNSVKELNKFKNRSKKRLYSKIGSLIFIIFIVVLTAIYFTYSKFTASDSFIILDSTVGDFTSSASDYSLALYVDGESTSEIPSSGNYYVTIGCDNGATGEWLEDRKIILLSNFTQTGTKCNVNFKTSYQDGTGASIPELYGGLIPITYDDKNNIVIADVSTEWYNYGNHEWANAILIDQSNATTKAKYINEDGTLISGTEVAMSDILQMYVWIPRYKYNGFDNNGSPQMIEIEFEDKTDINSTSGWRTHSAFTFGDEELNGIWVGKFESSGTIDDITIKPNVSSLRNLKISDMFNASLAIKEYSKFGLSVYKIDTHMMKNMEWGAVAYLTNSKYGRYESNGICISSGCEVWINNNSNFTVGCAGDSVSASSTSSCNQWNTANGVNASTTGTIYGIYDMSGGARESVMGNMKSSGNIWFPSIFEPDASGLSQAPEDKYYDSYSYNDESSSYYSYGMYGDATKETARWNSDNASFAYKSSHWFYRGEGYNSGAGAGVFAFGAYKGAATSDSSFRVVLVRA